jgi:uncharacterized protein YjbI with pentapeptide repeats
MEAKMNTQLEELLSHLRTTGNREALKAVDQLRDKGWLTDGSMQGVAMCRVPLQGANLEDANLCCAGLHQANLVGVNLSRAKLQGAKLSLCNLHGANLKDAELENTDFYKASLNGAQNLMEAQLVQASRLLGVTMPNGERYDGRFSLFGDLALAKWSNIDTDDPEAMAAFYGVPLDVYQKGQLEVVTA